MYMNACVRVCVRVRACVCDIHDFELLRYVWLSFCMMYEDEW